MDLFAFIFPGINEYPVLTSGWSCMNANAYLKGGMSYNATTGFLTVPVDGPYFIYSQIMVNTTEPLGHVTVFCEPKKSSDCEGLSGVITSSMIKILTRSKQPGNQDFASNYQGAVKFLKAGSQLALIPPLDYSGEYTYFAEQTQAYFGAFLVSHLPSQAQNATSPSLPTSCK